MSERKMVEVFRYSGFDTEEEARKWAETVRKEMDSLLESFMKPLKVKFLSFVYKTE